MIEQGPRFLPPFCIDERVGQDHFSDDRSPIVISERSTTGVEEFPIERKSFLGPSRLPEPVRQVVSRDKRLPTPRSVPLLVAGQGLTPGREEGFRRGVSLLAIPKGGERPSSDPP